MKSPFVFRSRISAIIKSKENNTNFRQLGVDWSVICICAQSDFMDREQGETLGQLASLPIAVSECPANITRVRYDTVICLLFLCREGEY